ncbi:nuclear transport factor 2 family protein [Flavobacterium sp. FlaQc-47]|uniref:nuclear transport factor 2 family protein n=1 Tax=Flavobacterium sp. FlaQc-47 TaxID=3374180 RepID=UPI00375703CE
MKKSNNSSLVLQYLATATKNIDQSLDLLHQDIIIEYPYAESAGLPIKIQGENIIKDSIGEFLAQVPGLEFKNPMIYETTDPDILFATYEAEVKVTATGKIYRQKYISNFGFNDGKIIYMAEYYDPAKLKEAFT